MVKEFCKAWEANKGNLEEYFRTHEQDEYDSYEALVKLLFDIVINPSMKSDYYRFSTDDMTVLDHGDYQGTLIFILHMDHHLLCVDEYVYTSVNYGSCSGCDTLMRINEYNWDKLPNEEQIKDYMTLCLHLIQKCSYMKDMSDEEVD